MYDEEQREQELERVEEKFGLFRKRLNLEIIRLSAETVSNIFSPAAFTLSVIDILNEAIKYVLDSIKDFEDEIEKRSVMR